MKMPPTMKELGQYVAPWVCRDCGQKAIWSYLDLAQRGVPVCPDCGNDMELDIRDGTIS